MGIVTNIRPNVGPDALRSIGFQMYVNRHKSISGELKCILSVRDIGPVDLVNGMPS